MEKISVCIIGYNEEKKIEDCLRSVAGVADEIVYVDSHSNDSTVEIVKKYTSKIFYKKFLGHVQQKDYAVSCASHDWVLALDCDERLSPELRDMIAKEKPHLNAQKISGYRFKRLTFYVYRWIRHSGWYPDHKVRLFHKKYCAWQGENPHDRVVCESGNVKTVNADILHYSFDSIDDHLKTIMAFSEIGAREAFAKGRKSGPFTIIFRTLWVAIHKVFIKFSFLDGTAGLIITGLSMAATWTKYSKLYIMQKDEKKKIKKNTSKRP